MLFNVNGPIGEFGPVRIYVLSFSVYVVIARSVLEIHVFILKKFLSDYNSCIKSQSRKKRTTVVYHVICYLSDVIVKVSFLANCRFRTVGLKHEGTDGTAYTDGTAGLVADGTDYKDVSAQ